MFYTPARWTYIVVSPRAPYWVLLYLPFIVIICIVRSQAQSFIFMLKTPLCYLWFCFIIHKCHRQLATCFWSCTEKTCKFRLILNTDKAKLMCFLRLINTDNGGYLIVAINDKVLERFWVYKYLGFLLEENLSFKLHIECLTKKLGLSYGHILYMHANFSSLKMLDSMYHAAWRSVSDSGFHTH